LPYAEQLRIKRERVVAALAPAGVDDARVAEVMGQSDPWYYRNKMEFSFATTREGALALGLYPTGFRREVLALRACYLLSPAAGPLLAAVRGWAAEQGLAAYRHRDNCGWLRTLTLREGKRTGQRMAILTTAATDAVDTARGTRPAAELASAFAQTIQGAATAIDQPLSSVYWIEQRIERGRPTRFVEHALAGAPLLEEELILPEGRRLRFAIHPRAFFQPNSLQAEVLYREVLAAASPEGGAEQAVDLYCGTGTIALCLAPYFERVVGVELSSEAVENARHNARRNGLHQVEFIAGEAGQVLAAGLPPGPGRLALAVVDPPRSGLTPEAVRHLLALDAPRIVYVSCNPEALGRDLAALGAAGYGLRSVRPVDMFPHTPHIETVVRLDR
jgi:23S rRNA (uracil1939-C5)-methyltransferase